MRPGGRLGPLVAWRGVAWALDASLNIHVEGTSGGKGLSGGMTGQLTTTPARDDLIFNFLLAVKQLSFESIDDEATKAT